MKTHCLLALATFVLWTTGCATTQRDSHVPSSAVSSRSGEILVISAVYGSGTKFADVTDRVNGLLHQPSVEFFARPEWLKADPTPGWNKTLIIVYEYKRQRRIFTAGEGGRVSAEQLLDGPKKRPRKKR